MHDELFSEAPLKPRCLQFSEAPSSPGNLVRKLSPEAPSKLVPPLTRAFLSMLGRRARLHLQMDVVRCKNQQLNGNVVHELQVPLDICGDFKIARYFNGQPLTDGAMSGYPVSQSRTVINKDIEASFTAAPNQSLDSALEHTHNKVMQELESSDYVSTL